MVVGRDVTGATGDVTGATGDVTGATGDVAGAKVRSCSTFAKATVDKVDATGDATGVHRFFNHNFPIKKFWNM